MAFEISWMQLAWLYETLFILAVFFAFREVILERIYGVRFKRWIEIDTGRHGYIILDKALNSAKIMGTTRTIAQENILKGFIYYIRDCVENLKLESASFDRKKWQYYCNTEEFDTVSKNQLLRQLLYVLEKNYIVAILILVVITLAVSAYSVYQIHQQQAAIGYLIQKIGEINAAAGQTGSVIKPG